MEDAAYCAVAWASGETQKSLAATFGVKTPTICTAICQFLNAYVDPAAMPEHWRMRNQPTDNRLRDSLIYGDERKALVPDALQAFQRSRGDAEHR
jgi:hypothetical protein